MRGREHPQGTEDATLLRHGWNWLVQHYTEYHDLLMVSLISVLANFGYGILNVSAIQPYAKSVGWTRELGWIYATYLVAETLARSPMGALGDVIGRKTLFVGASAVGAVTAFLWTVIPVLWIILAVHAVDGMLFAAFYTATIVTMTEAVGEKQRTAGSTVFVISLLIGLSTGPVLGGYANELTHSKLTSFYVTSAIFALVAFIAGYWFPSRILEREKKTGAEHKGVNMWQGIWQSIQAVPLLLLLAVFIFLPPGFIIPIVKLFTMTVFGFSEGEFGLAFVIGAVAVGIISLGTQWLTNKWGKVWAVQTGLVVAAVGTYLLVFIYNVWADMVFAALMGLGYVMLVPAWIALYTEQAPAEIRGAVVGVTGLGQGIGLITGVALGSYFYTSVPIHVDGLYLPAHYTPFLAMALALTFAAAFAFFFLKSAANHRNHHQQHSPRETGG